jgi:hypothetical protein
MYYIHPYMFQNVLGELPHRFDAHALEARVLRNYPTEFAQELQRFAGAADPLRSFSAAFAQSFDRQFRQFVTRTTKVQSPNLGGRLSMNQEWQQ